MSGTLHPRWSWCVVSIGTSGEAPIWQLIKRLRSCAQADAARRVFGSFFRPFNWSTGSKAGSSCGLRWLSFQAASYSFHRPLAIRYNDWTSAKPFVLSGSSRSSLRRRFRFKLEVDVADPLGPCCWKGLWCLLPLAAATGRRSDLSSRLARGEGSRIARHALQAGFRKRYKSSRFARTVDGPW